jgi:hypothetical protein
MPEAFILPLQASKRTNTVRYTMQQPTERESAESGQALKERKVGGGVGAEKAVSKVDSASIIKYLQRDVSRSSLRDACG